MAGKFEIYQDAKGQFRFRLKAGNNPVAVGIAVGATYGAVDSMSSGGDLENIFTEAFAGAFIGGITGG